MNREKCYPYYLINGNGGNKMGVFNNWEYNAEDEAARRAAVMEEFLNSNDSHLLMLDEPEIQEQQQKPVVKIINHKGFYSADCPQCGETKILSSELNSLSAVCDRCYCPFDLEN